ncbi:MAG: HAD family phosphatase [Treponema sp.]|jgi:putative hydrolase of the HAD superfamily|nr:HAD family phosphatase [Treponema sp.]
MSIKVIVFDYGGVICFTPTPEMRSELVKLSGLSAETLWELDRKYRGEWDRGTYDGIGHYRFMLAKAGVSLNDDSLARIARADIESWSHINPDTVKLMRDIKAAGLRVGILSNIPHDFPRDIASHSDALPVFAEADIAVYSCELGIIKPEAGIYEELMKKADCLYEEIVFFDDKVDNVNKARELGIQAFLWEGAEQARKIVSGMTGVSI